MKSDLFNQSGEKIGEINLPEKIFNRALNSDLLHQAVLYYESLPRQLIAKTKNRSEVRGGGRKPWRQKGTGRARHGSIRSPLWKGGGVTFGPIPEKQYQTKLPKKFRRGALSVVLSQKQKEGEIIFIDKIKVLRPKTKAISEILKNLVKIKKDIDKKRIIFILAKRNENFLKAVRNIKKVSSIGMDSLNPYILLKNKYLVIEKEAIKQLTINS